MGGNGPVRMRPSRVLRKLRAGQIVSCFKLNLDTARAAEMAAIAGYDCIWSDMEHIATDWSLLESQIWAAKAGDSDVMVRVARGGYSDYIRPLELDAAGIMVPHIMSLEDAKRVVWMTRFHPVGRRPMDGGNADAAFCNVPLDEYFEQANRERFVAIQIEDPEPLDELDEIAALEGIDIIFFGPGDFSQGIGAPAEWNHPRILDTRKRIADACLAHGKFAGVPATVDNIDEIIALGYRFIGFGADVLGIKGYCDRLMCEFHKREVEE